MEVRRALAECRDDLMRAGSQGPGSIGGPAVSRPFVETLTAWLPSLGPWRMPLGASALLALGFVAARVTTPALPARSSGVPHPDVISAVRSVQPAHEVPSPAKYKSCWTKPAAGSSRDN